jgi:hypothetical protein
VKIQKEWVQGSVGENWNLANEGRVMWILGKEHFHGLFW